MKDLLKYVLAQKMISAFTDSHKHINKKIIEFEKRNNRKLRILDIGCADLVNTRKYLKDVENYQLYAFDHFDSISDKSVKYKKMELENDKFPYEKNYFDVIIAGQVIEHILDKDHLIEECHRVLKKKGLFICATENVASFDNIISLILGQEPISQHTGAKFNCQSFLSAHFMEKIETNRYAHKNVCSYFGLKRLIRINGFKKMKMFSMGNICKVFEKIFPIYNRVLIVYAYK